MIIDVIAKSSLNFFLSSLSFSGLFNCFLTRLLFLFQFISRHQQQQQHFIKSAVIYLSAISLSFPLSFVSTDRATHSGVPFCLQVSQTSSATEIEIYTSSSCRRAIRLVRLGKPVCLIAPSPTPASLRIEAAAVGGRKRRGDDSRRNHCGRIEHGTARLRCSVATESMTARF